MNKFIITSLFTFLILITNAQPLANFSVRLIKGNPGLVHTVKANIGHLAELSDGQIGLYEVAGKKRVPVTCQVYRQNGTWLYWQVQPSNKKTRIFELVKPHEISPPIIHSDKWDSALTISYQQKKLVRYYYETVYPPAGIDTNYKRSGFIHPLWAPNGQELTQIQPEDHYHHYGIWNPWTKTYFEKDTVDFWNLKDRKGTVRFVQFTDILSGPVFAEYTALHAHVVFKKDDTEKIALNEWQTVRVYKPEEEENYYLVDITSKIQCAGTSPLLIVAYRYGGLGWRATSYWHHKNFEVLTSEGKTRADTDGSRSRWAIVQGALPGNDSGGVVLMSSPQNYNHPEPMRIWAQDANPRGDMFFNYAPTKDRDWLLEPGNTYVLKYRLVVFNGKVNASFADEVWLQFANPIEAKLIR